MLEIVGLLQNKINQKYNRTDMFGYRSGIPKVRFETKRMIVRLAYERDAEKLANYYTLNRHFLIPWEPVRDKSHYLPSGWEHRLLYINELHRQESAFHFLLLTPKEDEVIGVANYSNVMRGAVNACFLGYSVGEKWQGQGYMSEALHETLRFMQRQQGMHRIMANYMPHNLRSGNLLAKHGFEREGYAKNYLQINQEWRDHVLTALTTRPSPKG